MNIFIAQIVGAFAVAFFILSIQYKKKKDILKLQFIANILYAIEYAFLGIFTATGMNLISSIRCLVFSKYGNREIPKKTLYIFMLLIVVVGFISYQNLLSLIPMGITLLYIISSYQKDTNKLRFIFLICSIIWFYYNFKVQAYVSLIGNLFEFTSGIISLIRFRKEKRKQRKREK